MFSLNFSKFLRTRFIQKTTGTSGIHKDLQRLNPPYKYVKTAVLIAAKKKKKTAIAIATKIIKKNIICSIVAAWYIELQVKQFCVFDNIELFSNGLFQNNYFKKHFSQKVKLK